MRKIAPKKKTRTQKNPSKFKYDRSKYINLGMPNPFYEKGYAQAIKDVQKIINIEVRHTKYYYDLEDTPFWRGAFYRLQNIKDRLKEMLKERKELI